MKCLLAVDPSIGSIGLAYIEQDRVISSRTMRTQSGSPITERLSEIAKHFAELAPKVDTAVIEYPDKFVKMGRGGKLLNFRSLQLLHMAIGVIVASLALYNVECHLYPVSEWKGKKPKGFTQAEAKYITGEKHNTHESDAIMMGLKFWKNQKLKRMIENGKERARN